MLIKQLVINVETGEESFTEVEYEAPAEDVIETKESKLERIEQAKTIKELKEIMKELI